MRFFMFRCPSTGFIAKGQAADPRPGELPHTNHKVHCSACGEGHLVDPTTGETWRHLPNRLLDKVRSDMPERRFPKPWTAEETEVCFIIRDQNGQALAYVYYEEERCRRAKASLLTREEARRIAINLAKLPDLLTAKKS